MLRTRHHSTPHSAPWRFGRQGLGAATLLTASLLTASLALPAAADYGSGSNYDYNNEYYQESDNSYSFARVLEGSATLRTLEGEREDLEVNQPVLVGDRLWVPYRSRLELVLSDRSLLRIEGDSEISFESIAYSSDTGDRHTLLRLHKGDAQLVVPRDVLGDSLPRIETPGASVFIHEEGTFRLSVNRDGYTEVVVREGLAELVAEQGSCLVHAGKVGFGSDRNGLQVSRARYRDSLERWGDDLTYRAAKYDNSYIDSSLRYVSAPLHEYGGWVKVGSRRAWRPHSKYRNAWRPYHRGYWRHTPVGATWVSRDPWGWVTHHYGSWDYNDGYGWVWYPGRRYAPARVHWYWGPSYVGWCPSGYYNNYYRRHHRGYRLGVGIYGYAGGSWNHFNSWSFTASVHFGHRRQHRHVYTGHELGRRGHRLDVGVVTSHVGRYGRRHHRASDIYASLRHEAGRRAHSGGRALPDVTEFIGRAPLRDRVATRVLRPEDANKPAIIDGGSFRRAGRADGNRTTTASGTTVIRSGRPGSSADKPGIVPGNPSNRGPATNRGSATNRGVATRSDERARASASDRTAVRRGAADKPAITTQERRGRATSAPSYDRRDAGRASGAASGTTVTRDRRPTANIPSRTAPGRDASAAKPGRIDSGSSASASSRDRIRRDNAARADAERRREAARAEERRRGSITRERPATVTPSPRSSAPRTSSPRATAPRTTRPNASDVRRESTRPTTRPQAPRPTTRRESTRPSTRSQAPRATTRQQAPRATTRSQAPRPTTRQQAPRPTTRSQAPRPTTRQQAPRPTTRQQAPRPTTRSQAPRPTTRQQAPRPTTRQQAPRSNNRGSSVQRGSSNRSSGGATVQRGNRGQRPQARGQSSSRGNGRQGAASKRRDNG